MNDKTGKFAIVTGASTGIGFELAKLAVDHGYDLLQAAIAHVAPAAVVAELHRRIAQPGTAVRH